MKIKKEYILFIAFVVIVGLLVGYLRFPKSFGRKCSCNPACDFASLQIDSCSLSNNTLKLEMKNTNVINLNVIIGYLYFPNRTYEIRYLTDHIPAFTSKEILIGDIPTGTSGYTITTECPNIKLERNISDCY